MADEIDTPNLDGLVDKLVESLTDPKRLQRVERSMRNAFAEGATVAHGAEIRSGSELHEYKQSKWEDVERVAGQLSGTVLAYIVGHLLGVEVSGEALRRAWKPDAPTPVGTLIGSTVMQIFERREGELTPGQEGAERLVGAVAGLAIKGWVEGIIVEEFQSLNGILHPVEKISHLANDIIDAVGLNRLMRVALRPLAQTLVATPLAWKTNKAFTPELLSVGDTLRAFISGDYDRAQAAEELARQGWSARRQEILLKQAYKRLSLDDALLLMRHGTIGRDYVLQNLRDTGIDEVTAEYILAAAEVKRFDAINDNSLSAVLRAFVDHEIDEGQLRTHLFAMIPDESERDSFISQARIQEGLTFKHLSHAEVREAVKREILPIAFYRAWLERENYTLEEGTALEILLRTEIDDTKKAAQHRKDVEAERAAEKQAREDEAKQRAAELEQQHALARRGQLGELRRAAVRGLIPLARVEELLTPIYDADTVAIYMAQVETDRADYVAAQQKRDDAEKRAQTKHIDVGQLQSAVLAGILSVDEYAARLRRDGMVDEDVSILRATLTARLQDIADAKATRREAEAAAKRRSIDLTRFESLVRRGHRSLDDYAALLQSLGFDDASRAAMRELLELQIADDTAARTLRDDAQARAKVKGLTLDQARRGVVLGAMTDGDFQKYLVDAGYTADAQRVLLAELRRDVADADAARRKREEAGAAKGPRELPLATLTRAARLGIIAPAAYQARLKALTYTDDDVSIEMELLLTEMAADAATRQRAEDLKAQADEPRALSLAQLERAVKLGEASIKAYTVAAAQIYAPDDVDLLVRVLQDEVEAIEAARARAEQLANQTDPLQTLSLTTIAKAVKRGQASIADYRTAAAALYAPDDVDLLVRVLQDELERLAEARARAEQLANQTDPDKTLSLVTLAKAVKLGQASIADYANAATLLYAPEDVDLLVRILEAELS